MPVLLESDGESMTHLLETVQTIEELSLNAWPSLQTVYYDGWILRFAQRYTRRANSVNPIYPSTLDPLEKVRYCEHTYGALEQTTVFKLTPLAADLDDVLAERGYLDDARTSVQTLNLDQLASPQTDAVTWSGELTDSWVDAYCRLNNVNRQHVPTMTRLLGNIVPARCFLALHHAGETAAAGLAVAERGYVGLFDIVTAEPFRRQGLGTELILHLLQWGKANGARQAYLQVMCNNPPALHLYAKLGFQEVYQYWYRARPAR